MHGCRLELCFSNVVALATLRTGRNGISVKGREERKDLSMHACMYAYMYRRNVPAWSCMFGIYTYVSIYVERERKRERERENNCRN